MIYYYRLSYPAAYKVVTSFNIKVTNTFMINNYNPMNQYRLVFIMGTFIFGKYILMLILLCVFLCVILNLKFPAGDKLRFI